jgi:hypothetical protein
MRTRSASPFLSATIPPWRRRALSRALTVRESAVRLPDTRRDGVGKGVPTSPLSLQNGGRFGQTAGETSGDDRNRELPPIQRDNTEVVRHQQVRKRPRFAFDSRRLHHCKSLLISILRC